MKKGKILHKSPGDCWSYTCIAHGLRLDTENGDVGWEERRRSRRKSMQRVMFTESPDSDSGDNFHKKRDNDGGKRKNKIIVALTAPIFKKTEGEK